MLNRPTSCGLPFLARLRSLLLTCGALFLGFGTAGILPCPRGALAEENPITLGSILILTGEGSSWGTAAKNGIDLAVARLNQKGGVLGRRIEVSHQDDHGEPKNSIAAFRHLVDVAKVKFIIGPTWSNLGLPLIEPAERSRTIMISPSLGVATFNEANRFLFTVWPHDIHLSRQLADHVFAKGHRRVALVGAEHVWVKEQSTAFRERYEELGGKVIFFTEPDPGSTDLRSEALKIKGIAGLEAVVSTTDGVLIGSLVAKELLQLGVRSPFYSISLDQAAIDAAQGGFEGMEFLTSFTPSQEFQSAYEDHFKVPIEISADSAYDAVMMLARAISEVGSEDTEEVAKKLSEIKEYKGESGLLHSDGKRGFTKKFALRKVLHGKPQ